jgi:hypothetical protein
MSKQIWAISFGAPVAGLVVLIGMQAAVAKQCSAEMPAIPPRHWSYRLIDGRKCWYEGENNFPKALLQWPEQTDVLSAFDKMEPPTVDPPAGVQTLVPPAPPHDEPGSASFDARWQALDMTHLRN